MIRHAILLWADEIEQNLGELVKFTQLFESYIRFGFCLTTSREEFEILFGHLFVFTSRHHRFSSEHASVEALVGVGSLERYRLLGELLVCGIPWLFFFLLEAIGFSCDSFFLFCENALARGKYPL